MSSSLIARLADAGVHSRDDFADLAVDEVVEITGVPEDQAKELIMKAREHWFAS
jgi:N utilization substance protein A